MVFQQSLESLCARVLNRHGQRTVSDVRSPKLGVVIIELDAIGVFIEILPDASGTYPGEVREAKTSVRIIQHTLQESDDLCGELYVHDLLSWSSFPPLSSIASWQQALIA